jgi:hypothetical protein
MVNAEFSVVVPPEIHNEFRLLRLALSRLPEVSDSIVVDNQEKFIKLRALGYDYVGATKDALLLAMIQSTIDNDDASLEELTAKRELIRSLVVRAEP